MNLPDKFATHTLDDLGYKASLKRVLSVKNLVWFGLSYLAPIEVFTQFGLMAGMTHGMMTLSYLVSTVVILFTAFSYAKMVSVLPCCGFRLYLCTTLCQSPYRFYHGLGYAARLYSAADGMHLVFGAVHE